MDEFLARALAGGLALAVVAGPFGCFVVWRRMAYFGDTLAHAALLGVVLGALLDLDFGIGIAALSLTLALAVGLMQRRRDLASDTVLGILSHGALALGLVVLSLMQDARINVMGWLLGDILSLDWFDVAVMWGGGAVLLAALAVLWRSLVAITIDEDLAAVEGHAVERARLGLMVLVALVVAAAMKVVGILLVTALLVVPAATARRFARTPEQMAALAVLVGAAAVVLGLGASWRFDTPSGPSVVVAALGVFLASRAVPGRG
ncbi:iron chelate uptake ABC transporter family permease subunit [Magnetospirillum aberrantis]|uniref:High-affinity zinc uptake system membrane protein ZnuB n=1 Tax=Magnetospirillum aberrantis SpK TaxID=908842 RepID=A0A7C9QTM4_9PROT|nr:iron chelate uptake ABC transporter family permease subunit [Magnetospirillum aberrantis]NFV80383.1 iron chelate uptake ABC transporter family permease subunit [Magnetospirillum aberrantis SpK]